MKSELCRIYLCILSLILFKTISCLKLTEQFSTSSSDECETVCKENYFPSLPAVAKSDMSACQRGCRFFNILSYKSKPDLNFTKKECYLSCDESYMEHKYKICKIGCDLAAQKEEMFNLFILSDDNENILLLDPNFDFLETDILYDPSIRSQIEVGYNVQYKIPEAHIKTMPVAKYTESIHSKIIIKASPVGDWLDCASKNSGIPRWVLLAAILTAVLVALFLSFSTEKREDPSSAIEANEDDVCCLAKNEVLPENSLSIASDEIKFSQPQRCIIESEKV